MPDRGTTALKRNSAVDDQRVRRHSKRRAANERVTGSLNTAPDNFTRPAHTNGPRLADRSKTACSNPASPWKVADTNTASPWKVAESNQGLPWKVALANLAWPLEDRRPELGDALEDRVPEPGAAEAGVSGGGVAESVEEGLEKGFSEGGTAVVDVGTGGQAGQIGVAVGVGQVGEACGVAGDVDAVAADRVLGGSAVATVRPVRRSWGRFAARVCHTQRTIEHGWMVADLASEAATLKSSLRFDSTRTKRKECTG